MGYPAGRARRCGRCRRFPRTTPPPSVDLDATARVVGLNPPPDLNAGSGGRRAVACWATNYSSSSRDRRRKNADADQATVSTAPFETDSGDGSQVIVPPQAITAPGVTPSEAGARGRNMVSGDSVMIHAGGHSSATRHVHGGPRWIALLQKPGWRTSHRHSPGHGFGQGRRAHCHRRRLEG